jgi:hypothetical protein
MTDARLAAMVTGLGNARYTMTSYITGRQHTKEELHEIADLALCWRPGIAAETAALNARICAALLWRNGWEYDPAVAYAPAVREGRKIVQRETRPRFAGIRRQWRGENNAGIESTPAPDVLGRIDQAWGLMNRRCVLVALSDIYFYGLPYARVGGGADMTAHGEAYGGANAISTLTAAILRCEAYALAPQEPGQ